MHDWLTQRCPWLSRTQVADLAVVVREVGQASHAPVRQALLDGKRHPVVLGTDGEVLDLGRETRLANPAQVKARWLRDRGCTFPGCSVPATWCEAHHVTWWSRGGTSDLLNLALLCGRHHTIVHDRDLIATITPTGVSWHL